MDTDCGVSSRVAYSFQDRQNQFEVNAATGDICLSSGLDYERLQAHHVTIVAVDRVSVLIYFNFCFFVLFFYNVVDKAYILPLRKFPKGKKVTLIFKINVCIIRKGKKIKKRLI